MLADKKPNVHRRRLNLSAAFPTYTNGNSGEAISGEAGDFLMRLLVLNHQPTSGSNLERVTWNERHIRAISVMPQ